MTGVLRCVDLFLRSFGVDLTRVFRQMRDMIGLYRCLLCIVFFFPVVFFVNLFHARFLCGEAPLRFMSIIGFSNERGDALLHFQG